jgi:hypothetical protein
MQPPTLRVKNRTRSVNNAVTTRSVGTISSRRFGAPWEGDCSRFRYRNAGHHRSHALRGHAAPDAPRRKKDAERQQRRYHAERGNDLLAAFWGPWEGDCSRFLYRNAGHHRSHALRGHAAPDAPRRKKDAERQQRRYHAERGNDQLAAFWGPVGGRLLAIPVSERWTSSFPRSAWACSPRRSASKNRTRSVNNAVTTRSVGTIRSRRLDAPWGELARDSGIGTLDTIVPTLCVGMQPPTLNPHPCTNHFPTSTLAVD